MSMTCSKDEQQSTLPQPPGLREKRTWKYEVRGKEKVMSGSSPTEGEKQKPHKLGTAEVDLEVMILLTPSEAT